MSIMKHAAIYERNRPAPKDPDKGRALTISIVAQRLECSVSNVYNLINSGQLVRTKVGAKKGYRVYESDLDAYIKACTDDECALDG